MKKYKILQGVSRVFRRRASYALDKRRPFLCGPFSGIFRILRQKTIDKKSVWVNVCSLKFWTDIFGPKTLFFQILHWGHIFVHSLAVGCNFGLNFTRIYHFWPLQIKLEPWNLCRLLCTGSSFVGCFFDRHDYNNFGWKDELDIEFLIMETFSSSEQFDLFNLFGSSFGKQIGR